MVAQTISKVTTAKGNRIRSGGHRISLRNLNLANRQLEALINKLRLRTRKYLTQTYVKRKRNLADKSFAGSSRKRLDGKQDRRWPYHVPMRALSKNFFDSLYRNYEQLGISERDFNEAMFLAIQRVRNPRINITFSGGTPPPRSHNLVWVQVAPFVWTGFQYGYRTWIDLSVYWKEFAIQLKKRVRTTNNPIEHRYRNLLKL